MRINWTITKADISKTKRFVSQQAGNSFVRNRIDKCINNPPSRISKQRFWHAMVSCLLTTQQRSGPNSAVNRFITGKPFPLAFRTCKTQRDLISFVQDTLGEFGGIRRLNRIGDELEHNLQVVDGVTWGAIRQMMSVLGKDGLADKERETAEFLRETLKGFGPKQSRNLLQSLGLTRYEMPLDSRITKWLNEFGFPVALSATALADPGYYNFVMDGIQLLCRKADVYPCVLDAAIFSSFDVDQWSPENLIW